LAVAGLVEVDVEVETPLEGEELLVAPLTPAADALGDAELRDVVEVDPVAPLAPNVTEPMAS